MMVMNESPRRETLDPDSERSEIALLEKVENY